MRKNSITFLILLLQLARVSAQQVSIEGGYIHTQYQNMVPFAENKGGFQFGVGYMHPIKDSLLFFKASLNYLQLDGVGTINYVNQINETVLSYQKSQEIYYLQIPMMMQCERQFVNKIRFGLQAGVTANYLLRAWQNPQPKNIDHNVSSNFERFVLGYQAGVYTKMKISPVMGLQLSYLYGSNFTQVQKQGSQSGFVAHVFTLGLVYQLIR